MIHLSDKKCVACLPAGRPARPLNEEEIKTYLSQLEEGRFDDAYRKWEVIEGKKIQKDFEFADFKQAMEFVNKVAAIAEEEGHHPDMHIFYNKVKIELWTHAINGLSDNDFILAAKIEKI